MLSDEEIYFLDALLWSYSSPIRVAELGAYVGGTTTIFGAATPEGSKIEVYDLFEHNPASRRRLQDDPLFDKQSFFPIWKRNTKKFSPKIVLQKGDLLETADSLSDPLDILYVDIVKHPCLINPLVAFYRRLKEGGLLIHQDYFHWQSPWLVYQMEYLLDYFELLGDVGFNMTVYRKKKALPASLPDFEKMPLEQRAELFDKAIARYGNSKAGMLRVSKMRMLEDDDKGRALQLATEIKQIHAESPRVMRYLKAASSFNDDRRW